MRRFAIFCHSLVSDWNHGNAHFLRGIYTALLNRGHEVSVYEPRDSWSLANLKRDYGDRPVQDFHAAFPRLQSTEYDVAELDLDRVLADVDVVLVHEWSSPELVRCVGEHRASRGTYRLLFHDTHHRSVTEPAAMGAYDLRHYDGVLAFGESVRQQYLLNGWARRVWTWHEAADSTIFYARAPRPTANAKYDLVWVGNWGDEERTAELHEFLLTPVRELGLRAWVHGVRYPAHALEALEGAGIEYKGWLPNYRAPELFADAHMTVHIPRGPYTKALPGVPTIRVFEALACEIPLISAPWVDSEHLFQPGADFWCAADGAEMKRRMRAILDDPEASASKARQGRCTIERRHTCFHRAMQLEQICEEIQ
jgi:spore maturation protein CgeB